MLKSIFTLLSIASCTFGAPSVLPRQSQNSSSSDELPCDYKYFTQPIDHFGAINGSFQQRYSIFTEYYKPGGPILLFQGEESLFLDCANTTILYTFAQELGGIVASLEHRYFGKSAPFGEESYTNENFKYLTLDNVMADAVNFVDAIRDNVTGAADSKVIVASGSYGGFVASAFRLNHPGTFYGAIASAGPAIGIGGNSSDPASYSWWYWINQVYQDQSRKASQNIKDAFTALQQRLDSGDVASLRSDLGLCSAIRANDTEGHAVMVSNLMQVYTNAAEHNYRTVHTGRVPVVSPLDKIIAIAENETDPIQLLNRTNWLWYGAPGPAQYGCLNITDPSWASGIVYLIQYVPFNYISCTYFPLFQSSYSKDTIFPAEGGADTYPAACKEQYGVDTLTPEQLGQRYHFTEAEIYNSTRIIWSKGQYDPTSATEPMEFPPTANPNASRAIYALDVAHREDLFAPDPTDHEGVQKLRKMELEIIKQWLSPIEV